MTAAILSIGTELTRGELVDTNATWLAEQLITLGFDVPEHATVEDDAGLIVDALRRLAPRDFPYRHDIEGPDDMPSHIRAMLTQVSVQIPVVAGTPLLGTWQGIFVVEHRDAPHAREVAVHFIGELE